MILISGEALIDLIPDPIKASAYDAVLGGSPYNVAIGLGRLGAPTAFISRISADGNGEALAASLGANGVDLSYVARDARPTTLAFVMRGTAKTGSRYSFYLDGTAYDGPWPFPAEWPKGARHLHVGSFSAVERPRTGGGRGDAACVRARHCQLRSQHPPVGHAGSRIRGPACRARFRSLASLRRARRISSGCTQAAALHESLAAWAKSGPQFCVATLGERGALALLGKERIEVPAPRVEVVDTVGAGDSLMSALLSAMDRDHALGAEASAPSNGTREVAKFCRDRICNHLHAQGLGSADAQGSRGGACGMSRNSPKKPASYGSEEPIVAGADRAV